MASKAFLRLADNARFTVNTFIPNCLLSRKEQPHTYSLAKAVSFVMTRLQKHNIKRYSKEYVKQLLRKEYKHLIGG
jgi:hypothetical protein